MPGEQEDTERDRSVTTVQEEPEYPSFDSGRGQEATSGEDAEDKAGDDQRSQDDAGAEQGPTSAAIDPLLTARWQAAGLLPSDLAELNQAATVQDALNGLLTKVEQRIATGPPQQPGQAGGPVQQPGGDGGQPRITQVAEPKLDWGDEDASDPRIRQNVGVVKDYLDARMAEMHGATAELYGMIQQFGYAQQGMQQSFRRSAVDRHLDGLGEEYHQFIGKGELPMGSPQDVLRDQISNHVDVLDQVYRQRGQAVPAATLVQQATYAMLGDKAALAARTKITNEAKKRDLSSGQFIAPSRGRRERDLPDGTDKAVAGVKRFRAERGG